MAKVFEQLDANANDKVTPSEFEDWKRRLEEQAFSPTAGWVARWDRHKKEYRFSTKDKELSDQFSLIAASKQHKYIEYELDGSITHDQGDSYRWGVFIPRLLVTPQRGRRLKKARFDGYDADSKPTGYWHPLPPEEVDVPLLEGWRKTLPKPTVIQSQVVPIKHLNLIFQLLSCCFLKVMTDSEDDSPLMADLRRANDHRQSVTTQRTFGSMMEIMSKRSLTLEPVLFRIEGEKYRMTFWNQKNKIRYVDVVCSGSRCAMMAFCESKAVAFSLFFCKSLVALQHGSNALLFTSKGF